MEWYGLGGRWSWLWTGKRGSDSVSRRGEESMSTTMESRLGRRRLRSDAAVVDDDEYMAAAVFDYDGVEAAITAVIQLRCSFFCSGWVFLGPGLISH